jgi:cytochrome c peroxidase
VWTKSLILCLCAAGVALVACTSSQTEEAAEHTKQAYDLSAPEWFPEMQIPDDNPMTLEAVALGHRLFFDPLLSKDYSVSCASCHHPELAFADNSPLSAGVHKQNVGRRNSYSLANVGYLEALFMEGGVPSLELQVLAPLGERSEMDLQIRDAVLRMQADSIYVQMSVDAYDREIDPWVVTRALAAYQRTLVSGNSSFDLYYYEKVDDAISIDAKKGWKHFQSLGCVSCHQLPLFTDQGYHNIGLYSKYADSGRARLTDRPEDHGKFRTPSLRNVAVTGPYMHDGSLGTLQEVIAHFERGGLKHQNRSPLIRPLQVDSTQKSQLIAFLTCLTDSSFITRGHRSLLPLILE